MTGRVMRTRLRRTAIVTLKGGSSFRGVLFEWDRECVVLRNAEALDVGQKRETVSVDGEIVLLRGDVEFVQLP